MSSCWPRKPRCGSKFKEHRIEDIFECHVCKQWYPWFKYSNSAAAAFGFESKGIYDAMDNYNEHGHRWACDVCTRDLLRTLKYSQITPT